MPFVQATRPITIDVSRKAAFVHNHPVSLTKTEFAILVRVLRTGFVTHEEILADVLGARDRVETSKVRFHIANLRSKLGPAGSLIETVPPRALRLNCAG